MFNRIWFAAAAVVAVSLAPCAARPVTASDVENGLLPLIVIKGDPLRPMALSERMQFYRVPGVSIAFFDKDRVLWTLCRGVGDIDANMPVTPDTVFQASSIAKMATAIGALRLVGEGKLSLDDDVNGQLKAWRVPPSAFTLKASVTLRRLLSHSAGTSVHGFSGYAVGTRLPTTIEMLNGATPATNAPVVVEATPGSRWRYSGGGYLIVQQLMAEATGHPFGEAMAELVLKPAGMSASTFEQPLAQARQASAASGHNADGTRITGRWMVFPEQAAGGLWSTPSDLARLAIALRKAIDGESQAILTTPLAREMVKRQSDDWGLGVNLGGEGGEPRFAHTGNNPGYQAVLIYSTRTKSGVAVMTNGNNQSGLFYEIVYAVAKAAGWKSYAPEERTIVTVDAAILATYAGRYLASGAPAFDVSVDGSRLYVAGGPFGEERVELLAESSTTFFIRSSGFRFVFAKNAAGEIDLTLGGGIQAKRVSP